MNNVVGDLSVTQNAPSTRFQKISKMKILQDDELSVCEKMAVTFPSRYSFPPNELCV